MGTGALTHTGGATTATPERSLRPPTPAVRLRRIALLLALFTLLPVGFSYLHTLSQPSNSSTGIRTVEWLRDHGAAGLVAKVESVYYSLTAPSKGGPTLQALPHVGFAAPGAGAKRVTSEHRPLRVHAMLHPALPGEGIWHAIRPGLASNPPVLITTLRDQPEYPRVLAGLAWINTKRSLLVLHAGRLEPSVPIPRSTMDVPSAERPKLLASFNSGFKLSDSHGGFVLHGRTYAAMRNGQATIVGYTNGSVNVIDWSQGANAPADVSFARQNLPLIVSHRKPSPDIGNSADWGATVENAVLVWRSGIGIDRHGNLIYAAGEEQTVSSLAKVLIRAGAVRAMELDINSYWVSFITYGASGAEDPANLLPSMNRPNTRYLEPDDRDFFTLSTR